MNTLKQMATNFSKPTPPKWRMIGYMALLSIPVIEAQIETLPEGTLPPLFKWSITTFLILFKVWTSTKSSDTPSQ